MRIVRVALRQGRRQFEGPPRLLLVPEIHDLQLVVGFAAQQLAGGARPQHLLKTLLAIPAGQEEEPAQHPRRPWRHRRVVVVHADPEIGVLKRRVEHKRPLQ